MEPYESQMIAIKIIRQLIAVVAEKIDDVQLERYIGKFINSFSLSEANGLMNLALEFGHNYQNFDKNEDFSCLKAQPLPSFKKDRWCGKPEIEQRIKQQKVIQKKQIQTQQSKPGSKKISQRVENLKLKKNIGNRFIKLIESNESDPKTDKMREKKKIQCLKELNMQQQKFQREEDVKISKNQKKPPSKYTYDYDGTKLYCKDQIIRKNLQNLFQIQHKQIDVNQTKPIQPSKLLKPPTQRDLMVTNQSFQNTDINQRMKQCLENIVLQNGVQFQQLKQQDQVLKESQVENQIVADIRTSNISEIKPLPLLQKQGSQNNEWIEPKTILKNKKKLQNEIYISQQWKQEIIKKFKISELKKNKTLQKPPNQQTFVMDPIDKYDFNIINTQKWGGTAKISSSQNKFLKKIIHSTYMNNGEKRRQRSKQGFNSDYFLQNSSSNKQIFRI